MDIHALDYSNNYIKNQRKNTKRPWHYGLNFFFQGHSCQFLYFNKRKTYLPLISRFMIFFLISGVNILLFCAKNDGKNNYTLKLIFFDQ
jgi:hypothetical protein